MEPNHTKAGLKNGTTPERGQNGCHPRRDGHGLPLPTRRPLRRRRRRRCVFLGGVGLFRARLCLPDHPSAQGGPAPAAAKAAGANPVRRVRVRGRGRGQRRRAGRPRAAPGDVIRGRPSSGASVRSISTGREGLTDVHVLIFTPFLSVLLICDPVTDEA